MDISIYKYNTFYLNWKVETIIHDSDADNAFELLYSTIMTKIQKCHAEGSSKITDSVVNENTNISDNKTPSDSSYIKF